MIGAVGMQETRIGSERVQHIDSRGSGRWQAIEHARAVFEESRLTSVRCGAL